MGTKNNPGTYDAYAAAEPDEPLFTLLARDPAAPGIVRDWVALRLRVGDLSVAQADEAIECAKSMEVWRVVNRQPKVED